MTGPRALTDAARPRLREGHPPVARGVPAVPFLDLGGVHAALAPELDRVWAHVLGHGRFVGGPEVAEFEAEFAAFCGAGSCVGVANGTDALRLVLEGLGVGPGDEVIVPTNTFFATAEAVVACGARCRFVDVEPTTLLIDPDQVAAAVGPATAAVVAVHLFGQMADMAALRAVTDRHGLALVEDAAQAHGARDCGARAGSAGDAAAFSFYPGKNLGALGDGGAVVTDDAALAARIRSLADHGRAPDERGRHDVVGCNSRLDTLQAGVLRVKLAQLEAHNLRRVAAMHLYRDLLPAGCTPVAVRPGAEPVYHLAVVEVDDRPGVIQALTASQIGWGVHYPVPCHRQPPFACGEALPAAERAARRILSLPMSPTLTAEQIEHVCAVLAGAIR